MLFIALTSVLLSYVDGSKTSQPDLGKVLFVNIVFRHGDRTPVHPYPNDPYKNVSYWPTGWGQLTQKGMEGHYELGKWLRSRYSDLLPKEYKKEDIFVQSTDVDRTLMSAYSNLAGLYEPDPSKNWNPKISWQPIPVHTIPEHDDYVLAAKKPCPQYDYLVDSLFDSPEIQKKLKDNEFLFETLTSATGMSVRTFQDLEEVYNTLYIENLYEFKLPSWTATLFPEPMRSLADFSFAIAAFNPKLARLKTGPLLADMVHHMEKKIKGKSFTRKAWVYSAHDTTVANLLQTLRVFDIKSPPYLSTVLIELREKNGEYFITTLYRNSSDVSPYLLTLPGCSALCPWEKFKELVYPVLPVDWDRECSLTLLQEVGEVTGVSLIAYTFICLLILLIFVVLIQRWRNPPSSKESFVYQSLSVDAS